MVKQSEKSRYGWCLSFIGILFLLPLVAHGAADEVVFQSSGASFAALLTVGDGAVIEWTFADGGTSSSASPTKDYGSEALRENRLKVTPWSALTGVNIGYDAGDGGSYAIPFLDQQGVVSVSGMENMAPYLELWCSSHNPITALDFSNFVHLTTIECFLCQSMTSVNLHNTPLLSRACFEDNDLTALDLSESPSLADLRGAVNNYPSIQWGSTGDHVWHICVRDNPQMTATLPEMTQFPLLQELFVWNDNQSGALHTASTHLTSVLASGNHYTTADFTGGFPAGRNGQIDLSNNALTSLVITDCPGLTQLDLRNNNLDQAAVDGIFAALDAFGANGGVLDLTGNTPPSITGRTHADSLGDRSWTVHYDGENDNVPPVISAITSSASATGATISWKTNKVTTATLEYGVTTSYGETVEFSTFTAARFAALTALTANHWYHFRITVKDALDNQIASPDHVFHTDSTRIVYWQDSFQRPDGAVGNGWIGVNDATALLENHSLLRTDASAYRIYYNPCNTALPADYFVTITVPNTTVWRSWWGLVGRYLPDTGLGSGNKAFWMSDGPTQMGIGHADFTNDLTPTVTGGYPASWSENRNHTVTLGYAGDTVTVYLDGAPYGYFTDTTNNQPGTGIGLVGDGGGTEYTVFDIQATNYLPSFTALRPFRFTDLPADRQEEEGKRIEWYVGVTDNTGALSYQWYKDGQPLAEETESTYIIESLNTTDQGQYYCLVREENGYEAETPPVTLSVIAENRLPVITGWGGLLLAGICLIMGIRRISMRTGW